MGTLETIEHDVTLTRIGTQLYRYPTLTGNATGNFAATSDDDGVIHPEVVISDRGNDEETFGFVDGREIRGIAPGNINFVDTRVGSGTESDSGDDLLIAPFFQPDVTIHGTELGDSFLVASTLFPVTIESHGGNDAVMIGSSNAAANGNLNEIDARLNLKTGAGQDRIFVNDQAFDTREVGYRLSTSGIKDVVKYPSVRDTILDDVAAYPNHFADINFEGVEFARVNGSATQKNSFLVLPSTFTRFFVDGIAQTNTEDTVTVLGFSESRSLIHENGDGAFTFEEDALQVHFAGIEDVNQTSFVSVDGFFEGSLEPFE
ncbi:MAG: hypothetical protein AB8B55_22385 [Mariniblastus sp.]